MKIILCFFNFGLKTFAGGKKNSHSPNLASWTDTDTVSCGASYLVRYLDRLSLLNPNPRSDLGRSSAGVSLLERMMTNFPLYQKREGAFDNCFVTKLLRNYRWDLITLAVSK